METKRLKLKLYKRTLFTWWQLATGPAHLIDAIVETATFGRYSVGLSTQVTRNLLVEGITKKRKEQMK